MMDNCGVSIIQLNCQRAYGALCDVGRVLSEKRVSVTVQQEVYLSCGSVCVDCPVPGEFSRVNVHLPGRQF